MFLFVLHPSDISLAVVGADYPNKRGPPRRFAIALCRPGDPVHLVPEPKNPVDPNAIMVLSEAGVLMGYVRANRALYVGRLLARGLEARAIFQEATSWGAVIRVSFDGNNPDLPPGPFADEPGPDWWSDEEPDAE